MDSEVKSSSEDAAPAVSIMRWRHHNPGPRYPGIVSGGLRAEGTAMIHSVTMKNFKALRSVEASLERFTVLVGPNASGKSSILQGLNCLCEAGRRSGTGNVA